MVKGTVAQDFVQPFAIETIFETIVYIFKYCQDVKMYSNVQ
jgi:hypothetical protein